MSIKKAVAISSLLSALALVGCDNDNGKTPDVGGDGVHPTTGVIDSSITLAGAEAWIAGNSGYALHVNGNAVRVSEASGGWSMASGRWFTNGDRITIIPMVGGADMSGDTKTYVYARSGNTLTFTTPRGEAVSTFVKTGGIVFGAHAGKEIDAALVLESGEAWISDGHTGGRGLAAQQQKGSVEQHC